ncbi:MAG: hypothetical protein HY553_13300 [Elusimicrobia bacterium]|nr:hypothetical protein [Elusimicrobiota bacterium]
MNWLLLCALVSPGSAAGRPANGAAFVRQTPPPPVMRAGETATVSVTMRATGTSAWTASGGYKLGAQGPADNRHWRGGRVGLSSSDRVGRNATKTFTFTVTAPATPGRYVFQWRMVQERVAWFGHPTPPVEVTVSPAPGADAIDLSQVTILNSPSDVAGWAKTARVTSIDLRAPDGIVIDFTKKDGQGAWPDVPDPSRWGTDPGIQYTIWMVLRIGGRWYAAGGMQNWTGRPRTGGPPSEFTHNWYYAADRWAPMTDYPVRPGERVGFFVTAGDARNNGRTLLRERSNVVLLDFPADAGGTFRF